MKKKAERGRRRRKRRRRRRMVMIKTTREYRDDGDQLSAQPVAVN